jgi:hypothetical protein
LFDREPHPAQATSICSVPTISPGWICTHSFFAKTTIDAVSLPLFDRYYYAPEADEDPDDRALVFALATMIAEWATGRFPFKYKFHGHGPLEGKHLKLKLPPPLASLLSRGMRVDRAERPNLAQFLDELERC